MQFDGQLTTVKGLQDEILTQVLLPPVGFADNDALT